MTVAKQMVEKITARVFCQCQGIGGNPVTIFVSASQHQHQQQPSSSSSSSSSVQQADKQSTSILSSSTKAQLAQSCEWESVVLQPSQRSMSFYMPTGEEVSFCAHAAMGGAMIMATTKGANANQADSLQFTATMQPDQTYESIIHDHDIVSLRITQAPYIEEKMRHPPQLQRILRDALSIQGPELVQPPSIMSSRRSIRYPTFCNASIARPKTLVYLSSVETLNKTQAPPVSDSFRLACDAIQSTGLYLYAPCTSNADDDDDDDTLDDCVEFECRQFPRASGYSEDPATGIAAAALAVSLHTRGLQVPYYKFHQGTSMGKPSLIMVEDLQVRDIDDAKHVSFLLTGKVEVDSRETIEIFEDE